MGLISPLHNVKGYSMSRPPVTIFVVCLLLCATATLAMGFFIQYAETVLNSEVKEKWLMFLNHLGAVDFCVTEGNSEIDVGSVTQFIDGGTLNSTDEVSITVSTSIHLIGGPKKLPTGMLAVYGNFKVEEWAVFEDSNHPLKFLKMTFVIPPELKESGYSNSCVILSVPLSFLPLSTRSSACVPSFLNKAITHVGTLLTIDSNSSDPDCKTGAYLKLNYYKGSEEDFFLSKMEKWNIYLRLIHFSYFLFAVAFALSCFSLFRSRIYPAVVTIDKILRNKAGRSRKAGQRKTETENGKLGPEIEITPPENERGLAEEERKRKIN